MPSIYHKDFDVTEFIGEKLAGIRNINPEICPPVAKILKLLSFKFLLMDFIFPDPSIIINFIYLYLLAEYVACRR